MLAAFAAAACGGNSVTTDASFDGLFFDGPQLHDVTVTIADDAPDFVEYQTPELGTWITADTTADRHTFILQVSSRFDVVDGCFGAPHDESASQLHGVLADGDTVVLRGCLPRVEDSPQPPDHVTGTMQQAGAVFQQTELGEGATGPWSFSTMMFPGTYDFAAVGSDRVAVERDVAIAADTTLPAFDLDATGVALAPIDVSIGGPIGSDSVLVEIDYDTAGSGGSGGAVAPVFAGQVAAGSATITAEALGSAALPAGDTEVAFAAASTPGALRTTASSSFPATAQITLPDVVTATIDDLHLTATWTPVFALDRAEYARHAGGLLRVATTASLLAENGTEVVFDPTFPSFNSAWLESNGNLVEEDVSLVSEPDAVTEQTWTLTSSVSAP